jgi:hypothetical protein
MQQNTNRKPATSHKEWLDRFEKHLVETSGTLPHDAREIAKSNLELIENDLSAIPEDQVHEEISNWTE